MAKSTGDFRGIVLSRQPYRESDLLVKLLTDRFGKKMFLVHRARKPGFKLAAGILPFTVGDYVGTVADDGLSYFTAVRGAEHFTHVVDDITLYAYAAYVLGLIDQAFPDGEALGAWYDFAATSLRLIDTGTDAAVVANIAEVQLLDAFGVQPNWRACVVDGRTDLPLDFSEAYGGVLCQNHWHLDAYRYHVAPKAMYLLRQFSAVPLNQLGNVQVSAATKSELRRVLDRIYSDMVGVTPKAKRFLDQMTTWQDHLPPLAGPTETPETPKKPS